MKKIIMLLTLLCLVSYSIEELENDASARSVALGGLGYIQGVDAFNGQLNPALKSMSPAVGVSNYSLLGEAQLTFLGYGDRWGDTYYHLGLISMQDQGYQEADLVNELPVASGRSFGLSTLAGVVGVAHDFGVFTLGASVKPVISKINNHETALSLVDTGLVFPWTFGQAAILWRNLPVGGPEQVPSIFKVGTSLQFNPVSVLLGYQRGSYWTDYAVGVEYQFVPSLLLRGAYSSSAISYGLGFEYAGFVLDIAAQNQTESVLNSSVRVSLQYQFAPALVQSDIVATPEPTKNVTLEMTGNPLIKKEPSVSKEIRPVIKPRKNENNPSRYPRDFREVELTI